MRSETDYPPLLIGSQFPSLGHLDDCTAATTLVAWSQTLNTTILIANTCKRWGCAFCGRRKCTKLAQIARTSEANRLITLTTNPNCHENPHTAYKATAPLATTLVQKIRRTHGSFEFLRVLEITKKGWPHYHFVARCGYIKQSWLSTAWAELSGAPIVDIRQIKDRQDVYWYVMKYLAKQHYIPWTNRRVSISRKFATAYTPPTREPLDLIDTKREHCHPRAYLHYYAPNTEWQQIGPLVWKKIGNATPQELF